MSKIKGLVSKAKGNAKDSTSEAKAWLSQGPPHYENMDDNIIILFKFWEHIQYLQVDNLKQLLSYNTINIQIA